MRAYKGFAVASDGTISCRGHQYVEGETYTHDGPVELCAAGYHACPMPLDTLRYYRPITSAYHEVEVGDDAQGDGDKVVAGRIKIGARLSIADLVKAHVDLVQDRTPRDRSVAAADKHESTAATSGDTSTAATSGYRSTAATSGYESTAATSGYRSTAAASGDGSSAAASGDRSSAAASGYESTAAASGYDSTAATSGYKSTAATSGDKSTAATSGDESTAATSGDESIAVAGGHECRARGALGCWLVLAERDDIGHILGVQAVPVDGDTIRAGALYVLRGGKVVEATS